MTSQDPLAAIAQALIQEFYRCESSLIETKECARAEWYGVPVSFVYLKPQMFALYKVGKRKYNVTFSRYITPENTRASLIKLKTRLERQVKRLENTSSNLLDS